MIKQDTQTPPEAPRASETVNAGQMPPMGGPGQPQEIPIQLVWQILGEKEWAIQIAGRQLAQAQQEAATLRQRLTEALTELGTLQKSIKDDTEKGLKNDRKIRRTIGELGDHPAVTD